MSSSEINILAGMKELISRFLSKPNGLISNLKVSSPARLLLLLISLDILFICLYILYLFTEILEDPGFSLQKDQGYSEIYQYLKWVGIVLIFGSLYRKKREPLYLHWVFLFSYLLLDDALLIHETAGARFAELVNLPAWFSLAGHHWGELIFFSALGLFFSTTLLVSYQSSTTKAKELSQFLILFIAGLVFFGMFLDFIHAWVENRSLRPWLAVVEDGGELIIVSLIAWFLTKKAPDIFDEDRVEIQIQTIVQAALLFGFCAFLFGIIQFSASGFAGNDGYYHAKMGLLVRQQGLKPAPPQLPHTILNEEDFYNHHILYHVYLSIFARVDPQTDGGDELTRSVKVASIWLPSLAFVGIWWLLCRQRVKWAWIWTLGLFVLSGDFLYRMSMPRAQSASLLILVLGLHWLFQRHYHRLAILGFVYVWMYDAFPLLLVMAGGYILAIWLAERRLAWQAALYPAGGILLGLIINPYFPKDLLFIFNHFLPKAFDSLTPVGGEWYPYETWEMVQDSGWTFGLFLLGVFSMGWGEKRPNQATLTAFFLTLIFGAMLFKARRFIEYFPAFVLIFTALATQPFFAQWESNLSSRKRWLPILLLLLFTFPLFQAFQSARVSMRSSDPADLYADASLWLKEYSEPGSTVFQLDWDDFTRLFFYDSDNIYTIGLDPTFMELHEPDLYVEWVEITQGLIDAPSTFIRDDFGGDYVFSDLEHDEFLTRAFEDPGLQEIFRSDDAIIFEVMGESSE